ncbi:lytic murein transglycosylase [Aureimonas leprariae]|uniref:Lytic murein transglycosylase n=1 Tax=Plantimonas leprariae TaxID=2615207 RepID=A0A7V7PQV3_9HYPH|nr:lytic murein transglycosylase [Aureimonas leprariae]KAB0680811.1 lytic murein transglycosylase [Aureimonas leprariae]
MLTLRPLALAFALFSASTALAQEQKTAQCGGDFTAFVDGVKAEAIAAGISQDAVERSVARMRIDEKVLARDRGQKVFTQTWGEFAGRMVNGYRLKLGKQNLQKYAAVFDKVEAETGVPGPAIAAFWGLETDYGAVLGDFDTLAALSTLAHDCRRPDLFRPHLIAAMRVVDSGYLQPEQMKGAWAGELGQTQILPEEYVKFGTDGDGNGSVNLLTDSPDVLATTGKFMASLGWQRGEPWLEAIRLPADFPWDRAALANKEPRAEFSKLGVTKADGSALESDGIEASILLPMGKSGPAFLAFKNFDVFLEWNNSLVYSLTAGYFATRLAGAEPVDMGSPEPGLSFDSMKSLQEKLAAKGYEVGKVDGILGGATREAVRQEQRRLGMPADGWPTDALLAAM